MTTRAPLFLLALLCLVLVPAVAQSTDQADRIAASFVLALGRVPTAVEAAQWTGKGKLAIAELVAQLQPQGDDAKQAVAVKACLDACGREPAADELRAWLVGSPSYSGLMKQHVAWLEAHPKDYALVVERAYQLVMQRHAFAEELDYWKAQPALSFVLLNACIENWARRNAPGLMATSGVATASVNSMWLTTVSLAPAVATEARVAAGLVHAGNADLAAALGRNIIAAGGDAVASAGGVHFVAAGR